MENKGIVKRNKFVDRVCGVRGLVALAGFAAAMVLSTAGASAAPLGSVTEFSAEGVTPLNIALGAEGNMWFTYGGGAKGIGKITPGGKITKYEIGPSPAHGGNSGATPYGIALGANGNMWFTDNGSTKTIGEITPEGSITEFSPGLSAGSDPEGIALGADGNMWFTNTGAGNIAIEKITPGGTITKTEVSVTNGAYSNAEPYRIALGANGNMWFTDIGETKAIGQVLPSGKIEEFASSHEPYVIAAGADGNSSSPSARPVVGQITPTGTIADFSSGLNNAAEPFGIAAGPEGNMWFADPGATKALGRVAPNGAITEFSFGFTGGMAPSYESIAAGPGGVWFTDTTTNAIGLVGTGTSSVGGEKGEKGEPGESVTGTPFSGAKGPCTEGGTEFVIETTTTYACNGAKGAAGAKGEEGKQGNEGPKGNPGAAGAAGAQGEKGPNGSNGAAGAQGPAGPAGTAGPAGAAGKIELVTCKKVGKKQKCTTKLVSGTVKFTATASRATLSRAGVIYAAGTARSAHGRLRLRLTSLRRLKRGHYTLTLATGQGRHERVVREAFTIK